MYKISLINMPFASLEMPSIALTQLKSVVDERFGDRVEVRTLYLNHDFAHYLGQDLYAVLGSVQASNAGLGDWFFRQIAFPREDDNAEEYFRRYFPQHDATRDELRQKILEKRTGLQRFLLRLIARKRLDKDHIVGLTTMFSQNVASMAMARLVKEKNPKTVTVMGGANCETPMGREIARLVEAVDFVFSGPSLINFPAFIENKIAGDIDACHRLRGVFSAENVDSEHLKGTGAVGEELPIEVPVPLDYEPFLNNLERSFPNGKVKASLTFETSRGCWWGERSHCTFCGLNGFTMAYRAMPSVAALELLREMLASYSNRCSLFKSVDNIMPREYLKEVFPHVETPPGVSFFYEVKADLKEEEMEILSRAGVTEIQPGIEALATSTLKLMRKGTSSFNNLAFLKGCLTYGINPGWNLLIGFPGEGPEVYEKYLRDIPLLTHLPPPSGAFPVRFDRYSPYFTQADSYGLELSPYDFYRYIYPFDEGSLMNLAYYFEDRNYNADYLANVAAWQVKLNAAVEAWVERWKGGDGKARGMLYLRRRGEVGVVCDTRSGEAVEISLDPLAVRILEVTYKKGWQPRQIARQIKADEPAVSDELVRLQGLGLLFEENGRFMSLVADKERRAKKEAVSPVGQPWQSDETLDGGSSEPTVGEAVV